MLKNKNRKNSGIILNFFSMEVYDYQMYYIFDKLNWERRDKMKRFNLNYKERGNHYRIE